MAPTIAVKKLATEYHYFLKTPDKNGFTQVFNIDHCEVCGCEVEGPNGVGVDVSPAMLAKAGMEGRDKKPIDGGWSELHECATCITCCYDKDAKKKEPEPQRFMSTCECQGKRPDCLCQPVHPDGTPMETAAERPKDALIHWRRADGQNACRGSSNDDPGVTIEHKNEITCHVCADAAEAPDPTKFYEWTVKVRVNATWVADGFDLDADRLHAMLSEDLGYASPYEIETEVVEAPDADEVAKEMGYKSAADKKQRKG